MQIEKFDQESLLTELKNCFDVKEIDKIARESKFIQRSTSQLSGQSFLMMNVFDSSDGKERSLTDSCDWLADHFGINIKKQSLDERYNTHAVSFIKTCFNRVLQIVNEGVMDRDLELPFSKIQLVDSTSFQIPEDLATFYEGYKGNGGKAILKMHLNYNLLNGEVTDICLTDGSANDNLYKLGKGEEIIPNCLYLRDLGYFDLKHFIKLDKDDAYFLSRAKTNAAYSMLNKKGEIERINIANYLPEPGQTKELKEVYIGCTNKKLKARLIMQAVPEEVAEKRLKKLEEYQSKHKKANISEQRKAMCFFNMYITNAPEEILTTEIVRLVYTLRWQIELMFKIWKSLFKIDQVKKMSIFRFECYIYSKLIAVLLTLHIHNKLGQFLWDEEEFELSPMKAAKLIKKKLTGLMDGLLTRGKKLANWIDQTTKLLIMRGKKSIRKLKGEPPKPTAWKIIKSLA